MLTRQQSFSTCAGSSYSSIGCKAWLAARAAGGLLWAAR